MKEYSYYDFHSTLDETAQAFLGMLHAHIGSRYSEYKPSDIKPTDKSEKEWVMYYRKKPRVGKAICSVYSMEGKLSVRFSFLSSMTHAFLVKQNEFSDRTRRNVLKQAVCVVHKSCRCYGGIAMCQYRQHYWVNNRLIKTCPYPWIYFYDLDENDIADINLLIDLQMDHMIQDQKEIKGGTYHEVNVQRCKEVQLMSVDESILDMDAFRREDHVKNTSRLDKYAKLYHLEPMGENKGIWYYFSNKSACGIDDEKDNDTHNEIPKGRYAVVTIDDPFTFSLVRVWNYICKWSWDNKKCINGLTLKNSENTACFVKFFMEGPKEFMAVHVPIK